MSIIQRNQKFNLQRQSISNLDLEENQIDIFQNLPLKNEDELEAVEIKLNNDLIYRKLMVSYICFFYKIPSYRLYIAFVFLLFIIYLKEVFYLFFIYFLFI